MRSLRVIAAVALTLSLLAGPVVAKTKLLVDLPLQWRPTTEMGELAAVDMTGLFELKLQMGTFKDNREDKTLIGENREDEDEGKILPVTTKDDLAGWTGERIGYVLTQFGLSVVPDGGDAVIEGEILRLKISETGVYESDLGIKITVKDKKGKTVWQGLTNASEKRFGRSYKAENYYEVLSDSVLEAAHNLLSDANFRAALKK